MSAAATKAIVLAACPFCDGNGLAREETTAPKACCHYVGCRSCGASTGLHPSAEIAATAWNRRASNQAVDGLVEQMRDVLSLWDADEMSILGSAATMQNRPEKWRAALARVGGAK